MSTWRHTRINTNSRVVLTAVLTEILGGRVNNQPLQQCGVWSERLPAACLLPYVGTEYRHVSKRKSDVLRCFDWQEHRGRWAGEEEELAGQDEQCDPADLPLPQPHRGRPHPPPAQPRTLRPGGGARRGRGRGHTGHHRPGDHSGKL